VQRPPTVAVCDHRYVFNPILTGNLDPSGPCPPGVNSAPVADALQRSQSASASVSPINQRSVAYRVDDPIAQKINESLRGIY